MVNPKVHFHLSAVTAGLHLKNLDYSLPVRFTKNINQECLFVKTNIPSNNERMAVFLMKGLPSLTLKTGCGFRLNTSEENFSVSVHAIDKQRAEDSVADVRGWLEETLNTGIQKHSYRKKLYIPYERDLPTVILIRALTYRGHNNIKAIASKTGTRISYSARGVQPLHLMVHANSEEQLWEAVRLVRNLFDQTLEQLTNWSVGKLMIPGDLPADFDIFSFMDLIPITLNEKFGESRPIVTLCWNEYKTAEEEPYAYYDIRADTPETLKEVGNLLLRLIQQEVEQFKYQVHDTVLYPPREKYKKFTKIMNTSGLHLFNNWKMNDDSLKNVRLHFKGNEERKNEKMMTGIPQKAAKIHIRGDNSEDVAKVVQELNRLIKNYTDVYTH